MKKETIEYLLASLENCLEVLHKESFNPALNSISIIVHALKIELLSEVLFKPGIIGSSEPIKINFNEKDKNGLHNLKKMCKCIITHCGCPIC